MEKRKILILDSTVVGGGVFADRGDIIEVSPQVAQDLLNERKATARPEAIAAREAQLGAAEPAPKRQRAAVVKNPEKAVASAD